MRHLLVTVAGLLAGCSLMLGKTYTRFETVPGGMGVIYIYAGDVMELQNVHIDHDPQTDGATRTVSMVSGGYYPYLVAPGLVRVLSGPEDGASCVMISVTANSQHWVRVTRQAPRVTALAADIAEPEISGLREISRENLTNASGRYPADECPLFGE